MRRVGGVEGCGWAGSARLRGADAPGRLGLLRRRLLRRRLLRRRLLGRGLLRTLLGGLLRRALGAPLGEQLGGPLDAQGRLVVALAQGGVVLAIGHVGPEAAAL